MTAEQLIDELVRAIDPPKGNVITLREFEPHFETDANWIAGTGQMPEDALRRYAKAVSKLREEHPHVDWIDVEKFDGKERSLFRYAI